MKIRLKILLKQIKEIYKNYLIDNLLLQIEEEGEEFIISNNN